MKEYPFDQTTFEQPTFEIRTTLYDLIPGFKEQDRKNLLDQVGEFEFSFYFLKNIPANSEDQVRYYYRYFESKKRGAWPDKFGGIKIYIDNFRVRPYGEPKTNSFDWLNLGERAAQDPAGIARKGRWRVRPNQIAGSVILSRIKNLEFKEKSSREDFQENAAHDLFKKILINIIKKFEDDRSTIGFNLGALYTEKHEEEAAENTANEIIDNEESDSNDEEKSPEDRIVWQKESDCRSILV